MKFGPIAILIATGAGFAWHSTTTAAINPEVNRQANQATLEGVTQSVQVGGGILTTSVGELGTIATESIGVLGDAATATGIGTTTSPTVPSGVPRQPDINPGSIAP